MAGPGSHPAPSTGILKRKPFARALKRHLIAGLIVIAPVTVTGFVLYWIFQRVDGLLGRILYPAIGLRIPGLGLLTLLLLLLGIGWAAERAVGSRMLVWWHAALERIPVARRIYGAADSIVRTVFNKEERPFNEVVLVEYPSPGRWSLGFVAGQAPAAARAQGEEMVTIFVPTTPNPTSGVLVMVPRASTRPVAMTIDEAFTFVLSAGSVSRPAERLQ